MSRRICLCRAIGQTARHLCGWSDGKNVIVIKPGKYRAPALLLLIVACVSVAAFRNVVSLGIISYVHLFYVPAIVAGLWYGRKSLEIVMPLGIIEILLNFLNAGQLTPAAFLDGFMLIVVAAIVGLLSENKDQLNEKLTESVSKLSRQNEELGQRETALRESEARFRVLAETTPSIILILQHGRLVYANPAAERILGYGLDDLNAMSSQTAMAMIDPDSKNLIDRAAVMEVLRGGGTVCKEMCIRVRSGDERWMNLTAGLMQYEDADAVMVTGFDVTERRMAEEQIRASLQEKEVLLKEDPPPGQEQPAGHLQPAEPPVRDTIDPQRDRAVQGEPGPRQVHGPRPREALPVRRPVAHRLRRLHRT